MKNIHIYYNLLLLIFTNITYSQTLTKDTLTLINLSLERSPANHMGHTHFEVNLINLRNSYYLYSSGGTNSFNYTQKCKNEINYDKYTSSLVDRENLIESKIIIPNSYFDSIFVLSGITFNIQFKTYRFISEFDIIHCDSMKYPNPFKYLTAKDSLIWLQTVLEKLPPNNIKNNLFLSDFVKVLSDFKTSLTSKCSFWSLYYGYGYQCSNYWDGKIIEGNDNEKKTSLPQKSRKRHACRNKKTKEEKK